MGSPENGRSMRCRSPLGAGALLRRTGEPYERDEEHQENCRGLKEIEGGEGEGLLVDRPIEVPLRLLGAYWRGLSPKSGRDRCGEGACSNAHEIVQPEAAAIWSGRKPDSDSATSGMKKEDTAAP